MNLEDLVRRAPRCEICGSRYYVVLYRVDGEEHTICLACLDRFGEDIVRNTLRLRRS